MKEAKAATFAAKRASTKPDDRSRRVGRLHVFDGRCKLVAVGAHFREDPIAKPIRPLPPVLVQEVLGIVRSTETLGQLELGPRKEPASEVGMARVEGDRRFWQLRPCVEKFCNRRDGADLFASHAVLEVEGAEHQVVEHELA